MDITNHTCPVSLFLTRTGLKPILKQVAMHSMPLITIYCTPSQQLPHTERQRPFLGFAKDLKMVGQNGPGIDIHRFPFHQFFQSIDEIDSILIIEKYIPFLDSPPHDMVPNPGRI
jgi:hypothetical protein